MRKRTILWLVLSGIILAIIGTALFVPAVVSAAGHCTQAQLNNGTCNITPTSVQSAAIAVGVILWIIAAILDLIAWIMALIRSARMRSWGWFIVVLLIHGLGTLIYAIAGPPDQPRMPAYYPPNQPPGYPPGYPPNQQPGYPPNYPPGYPPPNYPQNYPPGQNPPAVG